MQKFVEKRYFAPVYGIKGRTVK